MHRYLQVIAGGERCKPKGGGCASVGSEMCVLMDAADPMCTERGGVIEHVVEAQNGRPLPLPHCGLFLFAFLVFVVHLVLES